MTGNKPEQTQKCCCKSSSIPEQAVDQNFPQEACCQTEQQANQCCKAQEECCCKTEIKALQEQLVDSQNKYIRLYAEFDNYKKRTQKEKQSYSQKSQEQVLKALLPIIDDFERSLYALKKPSESAVVEIEQGVELIYTKCKKLLSSFGVEEIDIQVGQAFNEAYAEAIMSKPKEAGAKSGEVLEVIEKGYKQNGEIIRHAKVVIGI